jgi:hypothetical protein
MSDHGTQLRWVAKCVNPNPPCQHSLWEETRVPGENTRLSVERWLILFTKVSLIRCEDQTFLSHDSGNANPQSRRWKVLALTIAPPKFLPPYLVTALFEAEQAVQILYIYWFNKYKTFSVLIYSYINTSVETRCPESFYTILSFPNFHECWYNWVYQYGKKFYYLFYNIAQRNIKEEMFRRFRVDIELYYTIGTYCENSLNNSWGKHKEKS